MKTIILEYQERYVCEIDSTKKSLTLVINAVVLLHSMAIEEHLKKWSSKSLQTNLT